MNRALLSFFLLHQLCAAVTCESLPAIRLPDTRIITSQRIAAGSFKLPAMSNPITGLPPFCRVAGEVRPTADSRIPFELWLPLNNWNRKFAGVGNVGFANFVLYRELANQLKRGYAAGSTANGYPGAEGASFAFGHPERVTDFAYRAVHEMTVTSKALARAFYGTAVKHSYWLGESTGGRQGLMEAQKYPADYDGIVAGAPPIHLTRYWPGQFDAGLGG